MSIIIKGLDIPKSCGECKFFDKSWIDGSASWCNLTEQHITYVGEVAEFCPLVEIPTPHGRLIDGDELKDTIADVIPSYTFHGDIYPTYKESSAFGYIDNAPTILEAEE